MTARPMCPQFHAAAFFADGRAAFGSDRGPTPFLFDVADSRRLRDFPGHTGPVLCVAVSPGGRRALSGSTDGTARLWDCDSGREVRSVAVNGQPVRAVTFRPGGAGVAAGADDGAIRVWDFARPARHRKWGDKVEQARRALWANPDDGPALAALGEWYAFRGIGEWAADLLERARAGGAPVSPLTLGRCYWKSGRLAEARREFRRAADQALGPAEYLDLCTRAIEGVLQRRPETRPSTGPGAGAGRAG